MRTRLALLLSCVCFAAAAQTPDERLFEAIHDSKPLVAEGLLVSGQANPRARAPNGETPLHLAVEKGMRDLAVLLLRSGAGVGVRSESGETPLHLAALHADPWFAALLLDARADPRARNDAGETPLHWAALTGNEATAQLLLDRGADPELADIRGNLPLHGAADSGDLPTVRLLVRRTRDREARNREGRSAADLARQRGYGAVAALLGGREAPKPSAAAPAGSTTSNIRSMDLDDPDHPRFKTY